MRTSHVPLIARPASARPASALAALACAGIATASCGPARGANGPVPPGLDGPAAESIDPLVRERIQIARERVLAGPQEPARWIDLGMTFEANALFEAALEAYEGAAGLEPGPGRARYHVGRMRAELGELQAALSAFDACRSGGTRYAPLEWRAGLLLLELGRLEEARSALERARALDPADPTPLLALGRLALASGNPLEALELLAPIARAFPTEKSLRALHDRARREAGAGAPDQEDGASTGPAEPETGWKNLRHDPWSAGVARQRTGRRELVSTARNHLRSGRPRRALDLLEPLNERYPDDLTIEGMRTAALVELGRAPEALEALERSAARLSPHPQRELSLGALLLRLEGPERAREHLERAVELNPASGQAWAKLGEALLALGEPEEARAKLSEAVARGSDDPATHALLARARAASPGDGGGEVER